MVNAKGARSEEYKATVSVLLSESTCVKNTVPPRSVQTDISVLANAAHENNLQILETAFGNRFNCRQ